MDGVALDKQLWLTSTFIFKNKVALNKIQQAKKRKKKLNLRTRYEFSRIFAKPKEKFVKSDSDSGC